MDEYRGNIEQWLKRAARQPASGNGAADEDRGWEELSAMLDAAPEDRGAVGSIPPRGLRWTRWLAVAALAVVVPIVLIFLSRKPDGQKHVTTGKTPNEQPMTGGKGTADPRSSAASTPAPPAGTPAGALSTSINTTHPDKDKNGYLKNIARADSGETAGSITSMGLLLYPVPTPDLLAGLKNTSLSGAVQSKLPVLPLPAYRIRYPHWAAGAGVLLSDGGGYGARVSLQYELPLQRGFYLQPYVGASYIGGQKKYFRHVHVQSTQNTMTDRYRIDSVWTLYRAESTIYADAGIRAGYRLKRFSFGTGIRYQHMLQSKGTVLPPVNRWLTDSSLVPASTIYNKAFSKKRMPGRQSFLLDIEAAYQWRSGLQTGVSYRVPVHQRAPEPAWDAPIPSGGGSGNWSSVGYDLWNLPRQRDKGMLEIYIRMPFGKH